MRQLPHFAKAYERFKDQGFEILSYSMDEKREDLVAAVKKHNMTWLNAVDPQLKGFEGKIAESMYVWGIPTSYLVSADGAIIARDWQIEDGKIEQYLERFFSGGAVISSIR